VGVLPINRNSNSNCLKRFGLVVHFYIFDVLTDKRPCCGWLGVRFIMETLTTRVTTSAQNIRRRRPGGTVAGGNRGGSKLTWLH